MNLEEDLSDDTARFERALIPLSLERAEEAARALRKEKGQKCGACVDCQRAANELREEVFCQCGRVFTPEDDDEPLERLAFYAESAIRELASAVGVHSPDLAIQLEEAASAIWVFMKELERDTERPPGGDNGISGETSL